MNKRYCYVIVCTDGESYWSKILASNGLASTGDGLEESNFDTVHLWNLLNEGWHPVRETAMSQNNDGCSYALLLLEKYEEDSA